MGRKNSLRTRIRWGLATAIGLCGSLLIALPAASLRPKGTAIIRPYPFPEAILYHGSRTRPQIALTFDACPRRERPDFSTAVVNYLQREHIPATFFISGEWAKQCPSCVKRLAGVPFFELALHGYHHWRSSKLTDPEIASEIERTRWELVGMGYNPEPFFRPPYGDCPPKLVAVAKKLGVLIVMWDVESGDPNPRLTTKRLEYRVLHLTHDGSIIIMHVNDGGIWTAQALPTIVTALRQRGFDFVSVADLLKHSGGKQTHNPLVTRVK